MLKKRGLSAVVTTLVIILLVLVSVGMIWVVVENVIAEGAKDISLGSFSKDVELQSAKVENNSFFVTVKRSSSDEELSKIKFIFRNGTDSEIIERKIDLGPFEQETFRFYLAELTLLDIIKISAMPVYSISVSGSESESVGAEDELKLKESFDGTRGSGTFAELGLTGMETVEYKFSSSSEDLPKFKKAIVDPLDVLPGDEQTFTVEVYSPHGIKNVTSFTELDNSNSTLIFDKINEYVENEETIEVWLVNWTVEDVHAETYRTNMTAVDNEENQNSHVLTWTDSCQSLITQHGVDWQLNEPCEFGSGIGGLDGGDIRLLGGGSLKITGGTFYRNEGTSISLEGGSIDLSENVGGSISKSPLYIVDGDGDGYGNGYATTGTTRAMNANGVTDCNDGNQYVHTNVAGLSSDNDQDGYTDTGPSTRCVGNSGSVGGRTYYRDTNNALPWLTDSQKLGTSDCNDGDQNKWQNLNGYTDFDGDSYGTGSSQQVCSGSSLPSGYASQGGDCYDSNTNVNPGQTNYFTAAYNIIDGGSSWDYDCSGSAEKEWTASGGCTSCNYDQFSICRGTRPGVGWIGSPPACGSSSTYYTYDGGLCNPDTCSPSGTCTWESRTQECH